MCPLSCREGNSRLRPFARYCVVALGNRAVGSRKFNGKMVSKSFLFLINTLDYTLTLFNSGDPLEEDMSL